MIWATREHVHLDRVATPWLIRRFVDRKATFAFIPATAPVPQGAIAFALPGAELGPHDEAGSTFRKVLSKFALTDPALHRMAQIVEAGIAHVMAKRNLSLASPQTLDAAEGVGLEALSLGLILLGAGDQEIIDRSAPIYDALYAYCRSALLEKEDPRLAALPPVARWSAIRSRLGET